jgi:hypothetical protein
VIHFADAQHRQRDKGANALTTEMTVFSTAATFACLVFNDFIEMVTAVIAAARRGKK